MQQYYEDLKKVWHGYDSEYVNNLIQGMLNAGHYVILGVNQNASRNGDARLSSDGVSHWVVVTALTADTITINNPFTNRQEQYLWGTFWDSLYELDLMEFIPPVISTGNKRPY